MKINTSWDTLKGKPVIVRLEMEAINPDESNILNEIFEGVKAGKAIAIKFEDFKEDKEEKQ